MTSLCHVTSRRVSFSSCYERVVSHTKESFHIWMSPFTRLAVKRLGSVLQYVVVCGVLAASHLCFHFLTLLWISDMGWLRLVGSLKLQVSFAKEPYKRVDILQKRLMILRSLLIVATSYHVYSSLAPLKRVMPHMKKS